jgi:hypothetical protein
MHARIEHAIRQALEAREKAAACIDTGTRDGWLQVAHNWDELISTYEEFQRVRDSALGSVVKLNPK